MEAIVVHGSDSESCEDGSVIVLSSGEGEDESTNKGGRLTRAKRNGRLFFVRERVQDVHGPWLYLFSSELGIDLDAPRDSPPEVMNQWWSEFVTDDDLEDYKKGPKLMLLFAILRQCELIGDKV